MSSKIIHAQSTKDLKVGEHKNVTLVCVASGVPSPKFQWYFRKASDTGQGERKLHHKNVCTVTVCF